MMYPLVRELAAQETPIRVPVTVTCRVLNLARAPYYRWLANPVTDADWVAAHRANALFDAHRDDPEFGYRLLVDEARDAGQPMADRTAWRLCSSNQWWSVFGKKRSTKNRPGPPAHDDRVQRDFTATGPNQLWLTDITEHRTREGKVYMGTAARIGDRLGHAAWVAGVVMMVSYSMGVNLPRRAWRRRRW